MLINSNNKAIKILGTTAVSESICQFLKAEQFAVSVESFEQAQAAADHDQFQYLVGVVKDLDLRKRMIQWLQHRDLHSPIYVHDASLVSTPDRIGTGSVIWPMASVLSADLGNFNVVACNAHVGHRAWLGDNCILLPGAMVLGTTYIEGDAVLQTGSTLLDGKRIMARDVTLLPRTLITKDIKEPGIYGGSPGRRLTTYKETD